jgi:threonine aldolase
MREAMANAELGDDVYGEDPTVNRLQEMMAEHLGKQAALFVPSGTMGNLATILAHCNRGDEVILGNLSHTYLFEAGGISALGGIHPRVIPNQLDGTLALDEIAGAIRSDDPHFPITRLICLENTHNRCGGASLSVKYTQAVAELARTKSIKIHLDGARIFNAAIAEGVSAAELASPADTVMVCLSKALCAPVGSVICGDSAFIRQAHRVRKQLGGGMRQAGVLAAAGIVALEEMVERLEQDHLRAQQLAQGLTQVPCLDVEREVPPTNMVYVRTKPEASMDAYQLVQSLAQQGVKLNAVDPGRLRLVVHYWIDDEAIERVLKAFHAILSP